VVFSSLKSAFSQHLRTLGITSFLILPWFLVVGVMLYLPATTTDDSSEYLIFAEAIKNWNFQSLEGTTIFRSPGYPLLLAMGDIIFGTINQNIFYLHLTIAILASLVAAWSLTNLIAPWITLGAFGWYLLFNAPFSMVILTEWAVGALLVVAFSLATRFLSSPTPKIYWLLCLVTSFTILSKPPMLILGIVVALGIFYLPGRAKYQGILALLIASLLPLTWARYNQMNYRIFSLSPRAGVVKLAQIGLLSERPIVCDNLCQTKEETTFVESFDGGRKGPSAYAPLDRAVERSYNHNYGLILSLLKDTKWDVLQTDQFTTRLRNQILEGQEILYYKFLFSEFISQVFILPGLFQIGFLVLLGLLVFKLLNGQASLKDPLIATTMIAVVIHFAHMAACVSVVHMLPRFFILTFLPVVYMLMLCLLFSYTKKGSLSAAL